MAREMFNPNFSLFIPVPEGGATFQPNPNSVVQNDEARGTNHLDFFKFVGRVVGKALFDGQCIDAYFTRSFYKHMLDQPLTYQACPTTSPFLPVLARHLSCSDQNVINVNPPFALLMAPFLSCAPLLKGFSRK